MTRQHRVLDDYFTKLLSTESLTKEDVLAALDGTFPKRRSLLSRMFGRIGVALVVALALGIGGYLALWHGAPVPSSRTEASGAVSSMAVTSPVAKRADRELPMRGGTSTVLSASPDTNRLAIEGDTVSVGGTSPAVHERAGVPSRFPERSLRPSAILNGEPLVRIEPWVHKSNLHVRLRTGNPDLRLDIVPKVRGIRLVELSAGELGAIGVHVTSDGVVSSYAIDTSTYQGSERGSVASRTRVQISRRSLSPDSADVRLVSERDIPSGVVVGTEHPWFALDFNRKFRTYRYHFAEFVMDAGFDTSGCGSVDVRTDSMYAALVGSPDFLNGCLLVRVPLPGEAGGGSVLLGFRNVPAMRLPERYRSSSGADMEEEPLASGDSARAFGKGIVMASMGEAERALDDGAAEARVPGNPYVDTWRTASGAILSTGLARNPVRSSVTVRGMLSAPRALTLSLYDIGGERVRLLTTGQSFPAGSFSIDGELSGVTSGIYLLVVATERGEQAVQRVIVE